MSCHGQFKSLAEPVHPQAWFRFGVFLLLDRIPAKDEETHLPEPDSAGESVPQANLGCSRRGSLQFAPSGWSPHGKALDPSQE